MSTICYVHLALMLYLWLLSSRFVVNFSMCTGCNFLNFNSSIIIYIIYKYAATIILLNKAVEKFCKAWCKIWDQTAQWTTGHQKNAHILFIYSIEGFFFLNKNQSLIVHLMHFKVVNSTNINDPLTIFESEQFQNRQTDSQKQQQIVCMHFPTLADVYIMRWKWLFNMTGLSPSIQRG